MAGDHTYSQSLPQTRILSQTGFYLTHIPIYSMIRCSRHKEMTLWYLFRDAVQTIWETSLWGI